MFGINLVSDPELAARQQQLNSQWFALNQTIDSCALTSSSAPAFSQFYADYDSWKEFFASGSDWSGDSKHTTDLWQVKLQDYTKLAKSYCQQASGAEPAYIPGVKDPPADEPGFFDTGIGLAKDALAIPGELTKTIGIFAAVIVAAILVAIIWVSMHGNLSAGPSGVSVGR
jgi:hypothetical protein